jgi:zinc protease
MRSTVLTLFAILNIAAAEPPTPQKVVAYEGVSEWRLANGLRILLVPDRALPTVTVSIHYHMGTAVEGAGEAGLAHLFEHMLFKGTTTRNNLWAELHDHGAQMNGWTWVDSTQFYETLPASDANLDFALDLEADRMVHSRLLQGDLDKEFSVVRNEFEIGESSPLRVLRDAMLSAAYRFHGYGRPTLGNKSDIEKMPVEKLRDFYKRWYRPDNATLVIGGRFDDKHALAEAQKRFGALPRPLQPLPQRYTVEPVQDGEREVVVRRAGDVGIVGLIYHGVAASADDYAAEMALADILAHKATGRLQAALVDTGLAASVETAEWPWAGPGVLQLFARVRKEQSLERARDKMLAVVEKLGDVHQEEVERFKRRFSKQSQLEIMDAAELSQDLGEWDVRGDWRLFYWLRDRVQQLDAAQVNAFARGHLKASNRTLGLFIPSAALDRAPLAETPNVAPLVAGYARDDAAAEGEAVEASLPSIDARVQRRELKSGMKLLLLPKTTRGHAVRLVVDVPFASAAELRGRHGAVSLLPGMLLRGTRRLSRAALEDEWDKLQATVRHGGDNVDDNEVRLTVTTTRDKLPAVIALVGEVLQHPAFSPVELESYRKEYLARTEELLQQPQTRMWTALWQRIVPQFPVGDVRRERSLEERIADARAVKASDLVAVQRQLGAGAAVAAIVGDFDVAAAQRALDESFGAWKAPTPYRPLERPFAATTAATESIRLADKPMAILGLGQAMALRDDDPDYPALVLGTFVLGGGMKSRLIERLREKEGLSYGTNAFVQADRREHRGLLVVAYAMCATANAERALRGLREELARLLRDGIPADELQAAKKSYRLQLEDSLASDDFVANALVDEAVVGRTLATWQARNQRIQALSPDDVKAALARHLTPSAQATVQVGDFKP